MTKKTEASTLRIYTVRCGSCGFESSALESDRAKACIVDHLQHAHTEATS